MNKHKHVKRDVGLAAVFGAFALAFIATYPAATMSAQLTAESVTAIYQVSSQDLNYNGIADTIESPSLELDNMASLEIES